MPYELPIDTHFNLDLTLEYDQGHRWRPDGENLGWYTSVLGQVRDRLLAAASSARRQLARPHS